MPENKTPKRRGITLKTPEDARRLIRRIVDKAFETGTELEHAGRISQLLTNWLAAWRLEKEENEWKAIAERLAVIEQAQAIEREHRGTSAQELKENLKILKEARKELELELS